MANFEQDDAIPEPLNDGLIWPISTRDVVVLGAGFSHALSSSMPLTDELGKKATAMLKIENPPDFKDGRFETWLSRLAEDQPDLSSARNAENFAKFKQLTNAIYAVMIEAQSQALSNGIHDWFYDLISALHFRRATVISFNYDLFIEKAIEQAQFHDASSPSNEGLTHWEHSLDHLPPFPPNPARLSGTPAPTLRLLKLHGSLNWFWVPGDSTGSTLHHWDLEMHDEDRRRYLPGRDPFIVPPAATKSAFLKNPIVVEIWRLAAQRLAEASVVHFVGYSMPLTDLHAAGLFADALGGTNSQLIVTNPCPDQIAESIRKMIDREPNIVAHGAEAFAESYVEETAKLVAETIRRNVENVPSDTRMIVAHPDGACRILKMTERGSALVLDVGEPDPLVTSPQENTDNPPTISDLAAELQHSDRLMIKRPNGLEFEVLGIERFATDAGVSHNWQMLVPADRARPRSSSNS